MRRLRLIKVSSKKNRPFRWRGELLYFGYKSINIIILSLVEQDRSATHREHSMY